MKRNQPTMNSIHLARMDLNLLVVFLAVFESRSVKVAARRLAVTASAVSHALGRLRHQLGDALFVQAAGAMVPTERAQQLVLPVRRCLGELEQAVTQRPRFDAARARRRFTLATSDYGEWLLLARLERALARRAPGVDLDVQPIPPDPERALESGALDLVVCLERHLAPSLRREELVRDRFVCVVRAGHPATRGALTLERYLELRHATVAPQGQAGGLVDGALARGGHRRRVALRLPHFMVAPFIIAETDLVMTLSARLVRQLRPALGLRVIDAPVELPAFRLMLGWHERQHHDPAQQWLRAQVARVLRPKTSD
jgi:DNA-binding transcriptional LysR family regulator